MTPPRSRGPSAAARTAAIASLTERLNAGLCVAKVLPTGQILTLVANGPMRRILGCAEDAPLSAVDLRALGGAVDPPPSGGSFLSMLAAPGGVVDHPVRLRRQDGSARWVEVTGAAHPDESGSLVIEALVRDVHARRRIDDQSRDLHQQLIQADKMAALGQAISGVAHELNNPLATILSWAERLSERDLDPALKRGVDVVLGEAERAARIVRNLLTFARKRQSTRALVDVNEVVAETLALRGPDLAAHEITVRTELTPDLPGVFGDSYQIQQVLLNLVINADQAMRTAHGRGTLTVRTATIGPDAVRIAVEDDGPGIPPETRARIFDPFFTTKPVGEGTGLGLSVAYAIVQEHGGKIAAGVGATGGALFSVDLPVSRTPGDAARSRLRAAPSMEAVKGATVLLVEDEQALAFAVAEGLRDAGLVVTHAADGSDALAHLRGRRFDVVVCDLKMPKVDGMQVNEHLMRQASPPPVIFVTGDSADPEAERFLAQPGRRWLAKPFRLNDLLTAIRDTLTAA
ncbi:MAG: ATP-binding protein [Vicinamibacterales bacterium]